MKRVSAKTEAQKTKPLTPAITTKAGATPKTNPSTSDDSPCKDIHLLLLDIIENFKIMGEYNKTFLNIKKFIQDREKHIEDLQDQLDLANGRIITLNAKSTKPDDEKLKSEIISLKEQLKEAQKTTFSSADFDKLSENLKKYINNQMIAIDKLKSEPKLSSKTSDLSDYKYSLNQILIKINPLPKTFDSLEKLKEFSKEFNIIKKQLINISESLGKLRVFIRVKPSKSTENTIKISGKSVTVNCNGKEQKYGDFYDVYNPEQTTDKICETEAIKDTIDQLYDGISIAFFGYGLSGSGKTFTLLGEEKNVGMLQIMLHKLVSKAKENDSTITIKLHEIFEQYIDMSSFIIKYDTKSEPVDKLDTTKFKAKIINLYSSDIKIEGTSSEFLGLDDDNVVIYDKSTSNIDKTIKNILTLINDHRKTHKRIVSTPNNPTSSRSNLYIIFKIIIDSTIVYLTIIDCGGRESPPEIFKLYFKDSRTKISQLLILKDKYGNLPDLESITELINNYQDYTEDKTPKKLPANFGINNKGVLLHGEYNSLDKINILYRHLVNIRDILKQGYAIVEFINHLAYVLRRKIDPEYDNFQLQEDIGIQDTDTKYDQTKFFIKPPKKLNDKDPMLTTTIIDYISKLSSLPTKFIMMCAVRQENSKCNDIHATFEFAQSLSSSAIGK